jgi:hypothetical protein
MRSDLSHKGRGKVNPAYAVGDGDGEGEDGDGAAPLTISR